MKLTTLFLLLSFFTFASGFQNKEEVIRVKNNAHFTIKIKANLTTGYQWVLNDSAYMKYLTLDSTFNLPLSNSKIIGAPEMQCFRFKAIAKGCCKLHFVYKRVWEKTENPADVKIYSVCVK
jgi:predicted secreted protein